MQSNKAMVQQSLELAARRALSRVTLDSNTVILAELAEIDQALVQARSRIAAIASRVRGENVVPLELGARSVGMRRKVG
jgi:hypothetical protein